MATLVYSKYLHIAPKMILAVFLWNCLPFYGYFNMLRELFQMYQFFVGTLYMMNVPYTKTPFVTETNKITPNVGVFAFTAFFYCCVWLTLYADNLEMVGTFLFFIVNCLSNIHILSLFFSNIPFTYAQEHVTELTIILLPMILLFVSLTLFVVGLYKISRIYKIKNEPVILDPNLKSHIDSNRMGLIESALLIMFLIFIYMQSEPSHVMGFTLNRTFTYDNLLMNMLFVLITFHILPYYAGSIVSYIMDYLSQLTTFLQTIVTLSWSFFIDYIFYILTTIVFMGWVIMTIYPSFSFASIFTLFKSFSEKGSNIANRSNTFKYFKEHFDITNKCYVELMISVSLLFVSAVKFYGKTTNMVDIS